VDFPKGGARRAEASFTSAVHSAPLEGAATRRRAIPFSIDGTVDSGVTVTNRLGSDQRIGITPQADGFHQRILEG